jgi:hypothetical protein
LAKTKRAKKVVPVKSKLKAASYIIPAAVVLLTVTAYFFWEGRSPSSSGSGTAKSPSAAAEKVDLPKLIGDWVRPDGGYVISIRRIAPDGRVEAAYLNPRPINVSRAEVSVVGDTATLFIELRDAGYPGSTYELSYDPRSDRLAGVYFQAAMGQRFDVVFVRKK